MSESEIDTKYNETIAKITKFINDKDYAKAIKFVNFKGRLTRDLARRYIVNDYENRVLGLIKKDNSLQDYIRTEYFRGFWL